MTPPDLPEFTRVSLSSVAARAGTAYVAANRYQLDDRAPYFWKTEDFGKSWTKIVSGIRPTISSRPSARTPAAKDCSTREPSTGSTCRSTPARNWQSLRSTSRHAGARPRGDEHDVVIAHARPLVLRARRRRGAAAARTGVVGGFHLFEPRDAVRRVQPAVFYYYAARVPDSVKAEVIDAAGAVVRTLAPPPPVGGGLQRITWDLRYPGAVVFPGMIMRSAQPGRGPIAPPAATSCACGSTVKCRSAVSR